MMIRVLRSVVLAAIVVTPQAGLSIEASYDCVHTGYTNIGWSARDSRYTAEAVPKVAKPAIVKLSEMNTERPFLTGQAVTRLQRLAGDGTTIWFAEHAPAGTVVIWTFFDKRRDLGPPSAVLVSTKTYDFMGPVSFTDVYACNPNAPSGHR